LFINQILDGLKNLHKPQQKFLQSLFRAMLICQSSINFRALARHSDLSERTFRRQFRHDFDFSELNRQIIANCLSVPPKAVAQDASFIKKSGKKTFGLDKFWNGSHSRPEKGLETSIISIVDHQQNASLALSAQQTPPNLATTERDREKPTRIDFYLQHFLETAPYFPPTIEYLLADGFYAKLKFVTGVRDSHFHLISRLRLDANLKYLYSGAQKRRGAKRKFAGKVDFSDLSKCAETGLKIDKNLVKLYSKEVWSVSLKQVIKLVVVKYKKRSVNLFSTDLNQSAEEILALYRSRFTIEFLIRDAKQSAGLEDCQARDQKAIEFHWNTSFSTVNLARLQAAESNSTADRKPFSMKSIKQQFFNEQLLELFICKLGLEQTLIKYKEHYETLRNYAVIST
jgi:Transposase DDE domain